MIPRRMLSLRTRLILGAGTIAAVAIVGSLLSIYGSSEISRRINTAIMAQQRMELLSVLSSRVNDYGMVAAEVMRVGSRTDEQRIAILQSRSAIVDGAFDRLNQAIAASVLDAERDGAFEQNRRATQSLGVARMRAQFDRLNRTLAEHDGIDSSRLRTALDGFATQFSPLLDQAIAQERRDRDAAFKSAERFKRDLVFASIFVLGIAIVALIVFQWGLVSPLMRRIGKITKTAQKIGGGALDQRIAIERRDELGLLFANVNRMAARLDRQRLAINADRDALNAIVETRTEELKAANARLEQVDSSRRRFYADVSHELRTPLTVILAEADLAMRAPTLDEPQTRESMALIHTRAHRLNRRINDLLRVARSESGQIELADEAFDLADAAENAVDDLASIANRRKIQIRIDRPDNAIARGDSDWTRQVIGGVLENAIRHSPNHSTIAITLTKCASSVKIEIRDQGDGIDLDNQATLFERFKRGDRATERTGFGVGLSLAKWIVERQGGRIAVTSPAGENRDIGTGTKVTIQLPRPPGEDRHGA